MSSSNIKEMTVLIEYVSTYDAFPSTYSSSVFFASLTSFKSV